MSKILKIAFIFLILVSVVSIITAAIFFVGKGREYTKRLAVEDKLALTLKEKRDLEKDLATVKSAKESMEAKIAIFEEKEKELSSQLEEAKQKNESVSAELDANKAELVKIKTDLDSEKKEKLAISKKLDTLQSDYDKIKKEALRLANEKMELEKSSAAAELPEKQAVNLDKIVVNSNEGPKAASQAVKPVMKGQVLVVNKEYGFVVVDIGQDKDIQKGIKFDVMDGPKVLGQAEIDKIYDTMSSATVLPGGNINDMKKGNVIVEIR